MIWLAAFDTETTDVDPETARIVSAAIVVLDPNGTITERHTWLLDPGVEIPAGATEIHGITTEHARENGVDAAPAVRVMAGLLQQLNDRGLPLVVFNAPYDLTLLDRELRRHEHDPLDLTGWTVLDPYVIDKHFHRFRKGKRQLAVMAEHYGIRFAGDAHGAGADATTAGRMMQRMTFPPKRGERNPGPRILSMHEPAALAADSAAWKLEQSQSFADYLRDQGKPEELDASWPMTVLGSPVIVRPSELDPDRHRLREEDRNWLRGWDNPYT